MNARRPVAATSGARPDAGWERIAPVLPAPEERELLGMRRGEAAFSIERLGIADGRAIEWRMTLIRGDRYRFVAHFEAGAPPPITASERD